MAEQHSELIQFNYIYIIETYKLLRAVKLQLNKHKKSFENRIRT